MNTPNSKYSLKVLPNNIVLIKDLFDEKNPTMTVTNDIENIIAYWTESGEVHWDLIRGVITKDSYGVYDILDVSPDGLFKGWKHTDIQSYDLAEQMLVAE